MNIAIIPARGGSKRIPKKNTRPFLGKPIIGYSIEVALDCGLFDRVIVSTDDEEIATTSRQFGAEAPFTRPEALSTDHVATLPVIRHAIQWAAEAYGEIHYACCIYATAPFVQAEDLAEGLRKLQENDQSDFAFSVTSFGFPIQRGLQKSEDGYLEMCWSEHEYTRSQDLQETYHDAGQFYWGRPESFLSATGFYSARALPVMLPRYRVQDIDTLEDWVRAEHMFSAIKHS